MIGVFDSGIGGLTVVKEIENKMPEAGIIYFGDTARYPYGNKSKETIESYALENARFLIEHGAKIIVVACNTASALAIEKLREDISIPIFEVVTPAVERAVSVTKNKRIGLIGTRGTVKSNIYKDKIQRLSPEAEVFSRACPLFVPLVEEGWLDRPETKKIIKSYFAALKNKNIDTLILGCTHYPILKKEIQAKIGRQVVLVDSAEEVVRNIEHFLSNNPELTRRLIGPSHYYLSDVSDHSKSIAEKWLGHNISFEKLSAFSA